jgi:hypothetical protein
LPGTRAGPESPPFNAASRESSRKPPSALSGPWQLVQREVNSGRTSLRKKRSLAVDAICVLSDAVSVLAAKQGANAANNAEIAKCKLQIANWDLKLFLNLRFAFCNLQFAILISGIVSPFD